LGWSAANLRLAGAVARYHRGALPRAGQKALLGSISPAAKRFAPSGFFVWLMPLTLTAAARLTNRNQPEQRLYSYCGARYSPRDRVAEEIAGARHMVELVYRRP